MRGILVKNIGDIWGDTQQLIVSRSKEPELPVRKLPELNKKIWGIRKGRLSIIAARPSHGKSAFALQIGMDLALQNKAVLFLSLEMSNEEIIERIFCREERVNNYDLLVGNYEPHIGKMKSFRAKMQALKFSVSDCLGKSWEEIDGYLQSLRCKPDVIILDYIQAIKNYSKTAKESLDEYIRNFREMAIRHNFAGILCSQVNRTNQETGTKDKSPQLHQLKGSGVLEEHADVVFLLWWPYKNGDDDQNKYQIEVAKNRNGKTGYFYLKYLPEYYLFEEKSYEESLSHYPKSGTYQTYSQKNFSKFNETT